jgi:hypothetical protein
MGARNPDEPGFTIDQVRWYFSPILMENPRWRRDEDKTGNRGVFERPVA